MKSENVKRREFFHRQKRNEIDTVIGGKSSIAGGEGGSGFSERSDGGIANAKRVTAMTLCHLAAVNNTRDIMKILLAHGGDLSKHILGKWSSVLCVC